MGIVMQLVSVGREDLNDLLISYYNPVGIHWVDDWERKLFKLFSKAEPEKLLDLDKSWPLFHFCFTGRTKRMNSEQIYSPPNSQCKENMILGGTRLDGGSDDYGSPVYLNILEVKQVSDYLSKRVISPYIDREGPVPEENIKLLMRHGVISPDSDVESTARWLTSALKGIESFYINAAKEERGVIKRKL